MTVRGSLAALAAAAALVASPLTANDYLVFLDGFPTLEGVRAPSNEIVARLKGAHAEAFRKIAPDLHAIGLAEAEVRHLWGSNALAVTADPADLEALAAIPGVLQVEEVYTVPMATYAVEDEAAPRGTVTWSVETIKAPEVWSQLGFDGEGVVVGHIDTGADANHPDLAGKVIGFKDFVDAGNTAIKDGQGHGTHTLGSIMGGATSGTAIGVAPKAKAVVARVFTSQGATTEVLLKSMEWMLDPDGDASTADAPPICSNSWGSNSRTDKSFWNIVTAWRAAGMLPVFAAGNAGPGTKTVGIPGGYPHVFAIGATARGDDIASFSSRGPSTWDGSDIVKPDVSAPGKSVYGAKDGGGYWSISGTSMATPHVAGACALLVQANPGMALEDMEAALSNTALELGTPGKDNDFGWGRIDVLAAMQASSSTSIFGKVKGPDGQPLAARVELGGKVLETSGDGAFKVRVTAGSYSLKVSAWAMVTHTETVTVADDSVEVNVTLAAAPAGMIHGTVIGPEGEGVAANVVVLDTPLAAVDADADGHFMVSLPHGSYSLRLRAQGYKAVVTEVTVTGHSNVSISMEEARGVLLVDDDGGKDFQSFYEGILAARPEGYELRAGEGPSAPSSGADLSGYATVLWITGDRTTALRSSAIQAIQEYLAEGGRVLLTGQNAAQALAGTPFLKNVLASSLVDGNLRTDHVDPEGSALGSFPSFEVDTGEDGAVHTTLPDALGASGAGATAFLRYKVLWPWVRRYAAVARRSGNSATILCGFGLEGVAGSGARKAVLDGMLNWLQAGSSEEAARVARFQELQVR